MITSISPFLAFTGDGNAALDAYASALPGAAITHRVSYNAEEEGPEGALRLGILQIGEFALRVMDVGARPDFGMSPALSVYIECSEAAEVDAMVNALSVEGAVFMPAGLYGFAERFAWIEDRFGVNWQFLHGPIGIAVGS